MAPEQMLHGTINRQTDVYSFGMTMYEVCHNATHHGFGGVDELSGPTRSMQGLHHLRILRTVS